MTLFSIYELANHFAPYVRYVHVKNVRYPEDQREVRRPEGWEYIKYAEPVKSGDLDFGKIIAFYYEAGYRGVLTLEDDSLGKYKMPELQEVHKHDVELVTYHFFAIFCLPYSKGWFIFLAKDHSARFLVISQLI